MPDWNITRRWQLNPDSSLAPMLCTTDELSQKPVVCLRGAAGSGKSFELERLASVERAAGHRVVTAHLPKLLAGESNQIATLSRWSKGVDPDTTLILDSIDEAMVPWPQVALVLEKWLEHSLATKKPRLRLGCRSAVFPPQLISTLQHLHHKDAVFQAELQPLSGDDWRTAATANGLDGEQFAQAIEQLKLPSLAAHPLTLRMLMDEYGRGQLADTTRSQLLGRAVTRLLQTDANRHDRGTQRRTPVHEMEDVAGWLACFAVFSGKEAIALDQLKNGKHSLSIQSLEALNELCPRLTHESITSTCCTGLFVGSGEKSVKFAHRNLAEFLAARQIARMPTHRARSLLASHAGWKHGVAGPLRETAMFVAEQNKPIAGWLAEHDPVVACASDLAWPDIIRRSIQTLVQRFAKGELTDAQVSGVVQQFSDSSYPESAADLRRAMKKRSARSEDVLEFAVALASRWRIAELSADLADLFLDTKAPLHPRVAAGYALNKIGASNDKRRMLKVFESKRPDPNCQLRGIALRCNWPENLSQKQLLRALDPPASKNFLGAYEGFLASLDSQGFCANDAILDGLAWASRRYRARGIYGHDVQIAQRIFHESLNHLSRPRVLKRLAASLLNLGPTYRDSPFEPLNAERVRSEQSRTCPLHNRLVERRAIVDELVRQSPDNEKLWLLVSAVPELATSEDFENYLGLATNARFSETTRRRYAEIARPLFRYEDAAMVEAWLQARRDPLIREVLDFALSIDLDSDTAKYGRESLRRQGKSKKRSRAVGSPGPREHIQKILDLCEKEGVQNFGHFCAYLTLEEDSEHAGHSRFLAETPGWKAADSETRSRIVRAAHRYLLEDTTSVEFATSQPLSSLHLPGLAAYWLLESVQPEVLTGLDVAWWKRWSWYIVRELHPNLHGEDNGPKARLLHRLCSQAPEVVVAHVGTIVSTDGDSARHLLISLLELLGDVQVPGLLAALTRVLGTIHSDHLKAKAVASYLLSKSEAAAATPCFEAINSAASAAKGLELRASLTTALLIEGSPKTWDRAISLLEQDESLGRRGLAAFAHEERLSLRKSRDSSERVPIDPRRAGVLTRLLFRHFPPDSDPKRDGAYTITPEDSAIQLRDRLLSHLGECGDPEAVTALRTLQTEFGKRYPWLKRPLSKAIERFYRGSWIPVPIDFMARVLADSEQFLIRSEQDALDGVQAAIEAYERSLHKGPQSMIEDLWDTHKRQPPSPKSEAHACDKLRNAINEYFFKYAMTTTREAEICRRKVSAKRGGEPGSEVDVWVEVRSAGTSCGVDIRVPIEVKRSINPEVDTGLRTQLVDRYMKQTASSCGVYVVMWYSAPGMRERNHAKWRTIKASRARMDVQVRAAQTKLAVQVLGIVVDCRLA